jgi:hypothetical protein
VKGLNMGSGFQNEQVITSARGISSVGCVVLASPLLHSTAMVWYVFGVVRWMVVCASPTPAKSDAARISPSNGLSIR